MRIIQPFVQMKANVKVLAVVLLFSSIAGCQTLQQVASLRFVEFAIDGVSGLNLAGVPLDRVQRYEDLGAVDVYRIASALAQNTLPARFTLHIGAENPADNPSDARIIEMAWTLFLEDRETIGGVLDREVLLPRGAITDIPLSIELDLVTFFGENLRDLVDVALSISGQGGRARNVRLQAVPTIHTPFGPIRYPEPITIVSRDVG